MLLKLVDGCIDNIESDHIDIVKRSWEADLLDFGSASSGNIEIYHQHDHVKHSSTGEQAIILIKLIINAFYLLDKQTKIFFG